jgi:hypothetical protein
MTDLAKEQRMRNNWAAPALVTLALLLHATVAEPATVDWTFSTVPAAGAITGAPGQTVGWGYTISNLGDTWLVSSTLDALPGFALATPTAGVFDFPILAPHTTVTVAYAAGLGLFEVTVDASAPPGSIDEGTFLLGADFWEGDPFDGGQLVASDTRSALYRLTATSPVAVPEPPTWLLILSSLAVLGLVRCRWPALGAWSTRTQPAPRSVTG